MSIFSFPCESGHWAHWFRYVVPWFHPISSLVFQPFRTLQSKISKRFEVFFFHTPCAKAVTHNCRLVLEALVGYVFWIRKRHLGGFCECLTAFFKRITQPHGPNAPKRPGNHSTSASPFACAVQMLRLQPFRPSGRARLEAIKDKTLSPVKATLEEAPHEPHPPHSA